jgi:para-aminobenzoate synthetase component 1
MLVQQLAGMPSPEQLACALAGSPGLAWLDSDGAAGAAGRYSFVAALPAESRRVPLGAPQPFRLLDTLAADAGSPAAGSGARQASDPCRRKPPPPLAAELPHWIGYIAFDALQPGPGSRSGPGVVLARYPALFVLDHAQARWFVAGDDRQACQRLLALVARPAPLPRACAGALAVADPAEHARAIERALALIARGDLYQVNLARRFCAPLSGDPLALALAMRRESPVPLGFYFDDGERCVLGRSMERFLHWDARSRTLLTRPIKGTVERAGDDAGERTALAADPKERAEHTMIIDLMRNDLGRIAEVGSVRVVERMQVEAFAHLQHLVSTIACTTRADVHASDILYATFPPGSVTGTPKLRAIAAIDALETAGRGIYTGALGYVDRAGGLSLAVAIRTAVVEAGVASYFAGGGIVEASDVAREIAETELKARVFVNALRALDRLDPAEVAQTDSLI